MNASPFEPDPSSDVAAGELDRFTLARAARGEAAAQTALVRCYEARVFALVGRMLGAAGAHAVEDLAQEIFLKALRALSRFDPGREARLSTWLLTIATRTCLDELRRRRRDRLVIAEVDVAGEASLEAALALRSAGRRAEAALAALSPEHRAVLVLRAYHDLDYDQIAAALEVDVGTVKSRLSRARAGLRAALGASDG